MSDKQLEQFQQQEAELLALSVTLNRWSQVMVELMIREREQKLVASDLPVEGDGEIDPFWEELG